MSYFGRQGDRMSQFIRLHHFQVVSFELNQLQVVVLLDKRQHLKTRAFCKKFIFQSFFIIGAVGDRPATVAEGVSTEELSRGRSHNFR